MYDVYAETSRSKGLRTIANENPGRTVLADALARLRRVPICSWTISNGYSPQRRIHLLRRGGHRSPAASGKQAGPFVERGAFTCVRLDPE